MAQKPFIIGHIVGTHGIKGDLRVFPLTDDIKRFELLKKVTVETSGGETTLEIENVWYHKKFVMLKLRGVDTMNAGLALKGSDIKIDASFALTLSENEYYIRDLLDMNVFDEEGGALGIITDVLPTGANDVYEVKNNEKKFYIPAIKDCILEVDVSNKKMVIRLLEGLL